MRLCTNEYKFATIIMMLKISCEAHDVFSLEYETVTKWRILEFSKHPIIMILDAGNDRNATFKDSFVKSINKNKTVLIMSGTEIPESISEDKIMQIVVQNVDVVFSTKIINSNIFDTPSMKIILRSKWSKLIVIVTTQDAQYACMQGKLSAEAHNTIEVFLNDLWHKHRIMFVVLYLPYVCPNDYVIYHDSKPTSEFLYNRTIKLINNTEQFSATSTNQGSVLTRNYPLRGSIFDRFPTSTYCSGTDVHIKKSDTLNGFCGLDGLIMADIVRHFQFKLYLPVQEPNYNKFGYQQENGVVTGSLGQVINGDVDMSFNARFMISYVENFFRYYHYLHPVTHDSLCAVMKQPKEKPLWHYPFATYGPLEWLFILTLFTTVGLFMWITARIKNKMYNKQAYSLLFYIRNSLNAGFFGFSFMRRNDLLILRGACLIGSILFLSTYQSFINYMFTTRWYARLSTLSDLVEAGTVIQTSPSIKNVIEIPANDVQKILLERSIVLNNTNSFDYVLRHPNTATWDRHTDAILLALMAYTNADGKPMLYVVNECLQSFFFSYITNVEFPFSNLLHVFIMRMTEAGLPDAYYKWTSRSLGLDVTLPITSSEPRPTEKINLGEQVIAFGVLIVGYILSAIVLAVEIWISKTRPCPYSRTQPIWRVVNLR